MSIDPINTITSRTVVLNRENIDTDQIIPARFLTTTTREGLGRHAFAGWRYLPDGRENPDFVLNQSENRGCRILVAGRNFGCGSSREHAPWALLDAGFRAVISSEFADIFRNNATRNGLLPIRLDEAAYPWLLAHSGVTVTIDLPNQRLTVPSTGCEFQFPIDVFAKHCLINGHDELEFLLSFDREIDVFETRST